MGCMNKVKGLWYSPGDEPATVRPVYFAEYQTGHLRNIPPLLRYFHINNVSPSGWVFINLLNAEIITG
jgi:hypothetical protein